MPSRDELVEVFEDTERRCAEDEVLRQAVVDAEAGTRFYGEGETPTVPAKRFDRTEVSVSGHRCLESAQFYRRRFPEARICVHNFASATNPGGGVRKGSRAQEEAICRCTTLYPALATPVNRRRFYNLHRDRRDARYTDACLYTPGVVVIKSDVDLPQPLPADRWIWVDVLTCAAPNLRSAPGNSMNPDRSAAVRLTSGEGHLGNRFCGQRCTLCGTIYPDP